MALGWAGDAQRAPGEKLAKWAEMQPGQTAELAKLPVGGNAQGAEWWRVEGTDSVKVTSGYSELVLLHLGLEICHLDCSLLGFLCVFSPLLSIFSTLMNNQL